MTTRIEQRVASGELQDVELFVFKENVIFESVSYKGVSKIALSFDTVLRIHQVKLGYT